MNEVQFQFEASLAFLFKDDSNSADTALESAPCSKRTPKASQQRVLVVDDEGLVADSLAEILEEHGFEAEVAYSGKEAIELANRACPDILMSDVLMPQLNGVETALAIREICPKVRVLLFSGQAGTVDILKQARSQGHDFELLPKPIHPDQLLKRLT
jgi:CheY-like chemotaxis protein